MVRLNLARLARFAYRVRRALWYVIHDYDTSLQQEGSNNHLFRQHADVVGSVGTYNRRVYTPTSG